MNLIFYYEEMEVSLFWEKRVGPARDTTGGLTFFNFFLIVRGVY